MFCGILPKKCHVALSLKNVMWLSPPCDARHSSFHSGEEFYPANVPPSPDISHPEFCPTDVPPFPDISHSRMGEKGDSISPVKHVWIL